MKRLAAILALSAVCAAPALAQEKELTEQQKRMQACNAGAKKCEFSDNTARQAYMSACLKGGAPACEAKITPQQQRMRDCNARADKESFPSGRERQAFMQQCLRN
jgi:psiF repeat